MLGEALLGHMETLPLTLGATRALPGNCISLFFISIHYYLIVDFIFLCSHDMYLVTVPFLGRKAYLDFLTIYKVTKLQGYNIFFLDLFYVCAWCPQTVHTCTLSCPSNKNTSKFQM